VAWREPSGTSFLYRQADACRSPILSLLTAWSIEAYGILRHVFSRLVADTFAVIVIHRIIRLWFQLSCHCVSNSYQSVSSVRTAIDTNHFLGEA
jgi:hypothetical protein